MHAFNILSTLLPTLLLLSSSAFSQATSTSTIPPLNLAFRTFPSGGQFVAFDPSLITSNGSYAAACSNDTIITGSDGGPAPPRCGTAFTFEGVGGLSLLYAKDGYTPIGVVQAEILEENCVSKPLPGQFCEDGVELTQRFACS